MPASKHTITVAEFASLGGKARANRQTSDERKDLAKKAAEARWKGHKKKKQKTAE